MVQWFTWSQKLVVSRHYALCIIYIDCEEVGFLIMEGDFCDETKNCAYILFLSCQLYTINESTAITYFTEEGHLSKSVYSWISTYAGVFWLKVGHVVRNIMKI
jgi:hypothetical protein